MESEREKLKEERIKLTYRVERAKSGTEYFELFRVLGNVGEERLLNEFIGYVENPHGKFKCHHYDKVERLIRMALENGGNDPDMLFEAYPMINGAVMEYKDVAIKNLDLAA